MVDIDKKCPLGLDDNDGCPKSHQKPDDERVFCIPLSERVTKMDPVELLRMEQSERAMLGCCVYSPEKG